MSIMRVPTVMIEGFVPYFDTVDQIKQTDVSKITVVYLKTAHRYRRYVFRSGNYTTKHANDLSLDCGYIKSNFVALNLGCWVLSPDTFYVDLVEDFNGAKGFSYSTDGSTSADNTPSLNAAMAYASAEAVYEIHIPGGQFWFKSAPNPVPTFVCIFGTGTKGSGRTTLIRGYNEAVANRGLLHIDGEVGFWGGNRFQFLMIIPSLNSTGGTGFSALSTPVEAVSDFLWEGCKVTYSGDALVSNTLGFWGTQVIDGVTVSNCGWTMDGVLKEGPGTVGLRDSSFVDVQIFGGSVFRSMVSFNWIGGQQHGHDGFNGVPKMIIGGSAAAKSQYVNIDIALCLSRPSFNQAKEVLFKAAIINTEGIANTASCDDILVLAGKIDGAVESNWAATCKVITGASA